MLLLGHLGITLAAGLLLRKGAITLTPNDERKNMIDDKLEDNDNRNLLRKLAYNIKKMDLRILLIGAMLPDIVDKPIGSFLFDDIFHNGRIFAHTLLFLLILTFAGFYYFKKKERSWLIILSMGSFIHLMQDQIWLMPRTLLWPLYGWTFDKLDVTGTEWLKMLYYELRSDVSVYVPEIIGGVIIIAFLLILLHKHTLKLFIRSGTF